MVVDDEDEEEAVRIEGPDEEPDHDKVVRHYEDYVARNGPRTDAALRELEQRLKKNGHSPHDA